jgi:hypothetical protein
MIAPNRAGSIASGRSRSSGVRRVILEAMKKDKLF